MPSPISARGPGIGYVPQGREIFPRLTVEENLLMGLRRKRCRARRIFEMFPVLQEHAAAGAAATSRAASSSSSRSAARWRCARGC